MTVGGKSLLLVLCLGERSSAWIYSTSSSLITGGGVLGAVNGEGLLVLKKSLAFGERDCFVSEPSIHSSFHLSFQ